MRYTLSSAFRSAVQPSGIPKFKLAARWGLFPGAFGNCLQGLPFGSVVRQRIARIGEGLRLDRDVCTVPFEEPFTPVVEFTEAGS